MGKVETSLKTARPKPSRRSELAAALSSSRSAFFSVAVFSVISNILMLTGALFMLQVYDRVLPSHSLPTLVGLAILAVFLYSVQGILDLIRGRILIRIGATLDEKLNSRVYDVIVGLPSKTKQNGDGLGPLRDFDNIRTFFSSAGFTALFDLPWLPLYLSIIFAFHTTLGLTALIGAIVLIFMTLLTELLMRKPTRLAATLAVSRNGFVDASRRNSEVLKAMGMARRMALRWGEVNRKYAVSQQHANDIAVGFGSVSKVLRIMLQSAMLAVGAYLVINQEATAGIIIAGSILAARALAPVDMAIANWKGFVAARQSWFRLRKLLELLPLQQTPMALPAPCKTLSVDHVSAMPPGASKLVLKDVHLTIPCGHGLGIIGPSASGKSSLIRLIVGTWEAARGQIRLDGATLSHWSPEALGRHIGYVPQDVELFSGTIAQNIARFETDATAESIIAAAQAAGVHELIVSSFSDGYETEIGEFAENLSAGQRQRIALARALYGDPFLVVLDEPNSNLDADGEAALTDAILSVRARGGIVVVAAHRPSALAGVDLILALANGRVVSFGPKEKVLGNILRPRTSDRSVLHAVGEQSTI